MAVTTKSAAESEPHVMPSLDPVYLVVGKGIQAFAIVEMNIGMIFATLLEPADRLRSVTAINAVKTFDGKLLVAEAVAGVAMPDHLRSSFQLLMKRVRAVQKTRNKLAHWNAQWHPGIVRNEDFDRVKPALVPPVWSAEAMQTFYGSRQPLTVKQLGAQVDDMHQLSTEMFAFDHELKNALRGAP